MEKGLSRFFCTAILPSVHPTDYANIRGVVRIISLKYPRSIRRRDASETFDIDRVIESDTWMIEVKEIFHSNIKQFYLNLPTQLSRRILTKR